ncbi:HD-GYP domain (fragment) [Candidatus Terasakiella magnetica]|uniref:HD-GYP domain n=1 Tax=Candidatus Terasakiella magnetica TaxID=1867952 RepID=A0A1C3RDG9_9PROT
MLQQLLSKSELTLAERLCKIHEEIRQLHPELCRVAIAVYDEERDNLKTFAHSTDGSSPISFYEARLSEAKSLQELANSSQTRIIDDLSQISGDNFHSQKLLESGYLSSMTQPIQFNGKLYGFLFFNSPVKGFFSDLRHATIKAYAGVISLLLINELQTLNTFKGAVQTAREFSRFRDEETGNHLERMSRYARLIARDLAPKHYKEDDWVEYVFQFSPLHDVGKVAVPDDILLKPGKLSPEEFEHMKDHVTKGVEIITMMNNEFGLNSLNFFETLYNIVAYHHECLNGKGYPYGLEGEEIPIEARICTVADVFDALTSRRPYKNAWTNEDAFEYLQSQAGKQLDPDCVTSLISHSERIKSIQAEFVEDYMG